MKIYLKNQEHKFNQHLAFFKKQGVMAYDKHKLHEKITSVPMETTKHFEDFDFSFLFDYKLFPTNIILAYSQWKDENREMKAGDSIVQQAFIPPFKRFSQKLIFAVRIKEVINEPHRKGYSYETIFGHVEKGISTFTVEKLEDSIIFKIHTFSKPGNLISKILAPFFSIPYQKYCTKKCLQEVKAKLEKQQD